MKYLSEVVAEGLTLTSINTYIHPDLPKEHVLVSLVFGTKTVSIEVLDDDSLRVSSSISSNSYVELKSNYSSPLHRVIGQPLRWAWTMTNNYGYFDGIQLEFAGAVEDTANIIQFQAIASRIDYRLVTSLT